MNSTELLDYWRGQVMDQVRPYLWSDTDAFVYMNEAQLQFCRMSEGIPDATTTEVCSVPVITGEITAEIHPSILHFRNAYLVSTGMELTIRNHNSVKKWDNHTGQITSMIIGMQDNLVRWDHTPMLDDEVSLLVFRLPLTDITDVDQDFEVDPRHHPSLALWMKHLGYLKNDVETYDKQQSDRAKAEFEQYCMQVKIEQGRYRHAPRAVSYGGI